MYLKNGDRVKFKNEIIYCTEVKGPLIEDNHIPILVILLS